MRPAPGVVGGVVLGLVLLLPGPPAAAQSGAVQGVKVQQLANAVLGIMSYMVAPDVTTGSLSIDNESTASADLFLTQLGGGFTWSRELPLYLEGNAAYARFDPVFVVSEGDKLRSVPTRWNAVALTGGIGWDFALAEHWVLRPIFNFTLGSVASDLRVARWWVDTPADDALPFLDGGTLDAYGLGGTLMLDYESFSAAADDDLEIRYTHVDLRSRGSTSQGVQGSATTESLGSGRAGVCPPAGVRCGVGRCGMSMKRRSRDFSAARPRPASRT